MLKINHENSIFSESKKDAAVFLTKSSSVKDLVRTIYNVHQFAIDYPANYREDYELFQTFIDLIKNSDMLYDCDEFDRIEIFEESYNALIKKNYSILLGRYEKYGQYKLDTAFVCIVTNEEYEKKKVFIK